MFVHPVQARSWHLGLVKRMFKYKRVCTVDFDFCQLGMQSDWHPVKTRTRVMTNSHKIANELARFQRDGSHLPMPLMNGRASACQVYHRMCSAQIYIGLAKQVGSFTLDTLDTTGGLLEVLEAHPHDEDAASERASMEHLH